MVTSALDPSGYHSFYFQFILFSILLYFNIALCSYFFFNANQVTFAGPLFNKVRSSKSDRRYESYRDEQRDHP